MLQVRCGPVNFNLRAKTNICSVSMAVTSTELFHALLYEKLAIRIIVSNVDAAVPAVD